MKRILLSALIGVLATSAAAAQSVRVTGLTTARYVDVKPLTTQERIALVPITQDLSINAWGFGTGVRLFAQLRGRASAGDETDLWPQADDQFDLVAAFLEVDRPTFRVRGGRQFKASSLGVYNYDGASLLIRPNRSLKAEIFGGWSLVPGENDQYPDAVIDAIEPYAPGMRRNLYGGELQLRLGGRVNMSALYQREIRTDRAAIHSERAAADATIKIGTGTLSGGIESDLAAEQINEARIQLQAPLFARTIGSIEARRYRPYFDLWTIWGFFNPVGFKEALANLHWGNAVGTASLHLGGGIRSYDDDDGGVEFDRLREDGWRVVTGASITPTPLVTLSGSYRRDIGFGAARSEGDVTAQLNLGGSNYVSASALAFQSAYELQVRDGTVYGLGTDAGFKLSDAARIGWSFAVYRHENEKPATELDWNQMRGTVWMEWTVGSNPDIKRVAQRSK